MVPPSTLARGLAALLLILAVVAGAAPAGAQPLDPRAVPAPLAPWVAWSMKGKDDTLCVAIEGDAGPARCAWPSRLSLALDEKGGTFTQAWHVDAPRWVPLPGDAKRWPLDVSLDKKAAVVVAQDGAPAVEVPAGDHAVSGSFRWDSLPESLHVPPQTGLLSLALRGEVVASPNRDGQGTIWLQKAATAVEGDHLELVVHRKVTDDIPLLLTTRVELHVAGKNRELLLGRALPAGFVPLSLEGPLPARLEQDGHLRVQARPGVFVLELVARSEAPLAELSRPEPAGTWREGDEVWVFEPRSDLRVVSIEGAAAIDPQQTTLPDAWKKLPAYAMKLGATLRLVQKRRGDADPPPNQLSLVRTLWLDFDGGGYTASDLITGTMTRDWRLSMAPPTVLGRVSVSGEDQFITHLGDSARMGVEIRQGTLRVSADSRIPGASGDLPAVGWESDFHQVSGTLHVPPGWRVLHASGVDAIPGTWVHHWTLLEVFVALVVAVAVARLFGRAWGVVALFTLVLTLPESDAPRWVWLGVLAFEALVRALRPGRARQGLAWGRGAALVVLAIAVVPFAVTQVRLGLYPALGAPGGAESGGVGDLGGLGMLKTDLAPAAPPPVDAPASPAPAAAAPDEADREEAKSGKARRMPGAGASVLNALGGSAASSTLDYRQSNAQVYDPNAAVQTGPGVPRWTWTTLSLGWSGPVASAQRLHLYLLSPGANLVLALARVLLLAALVLRLVPWRPRMPWQAAAAGVIALVLLVPRPARAEIPDTATLDDLRERLTRAPTCGSSCASVPRLAVEIREGELRARLEVNAAARAAVPLPGGTGQWSPVDVQLDGKPATAMLRLPDGVLWIEVVAGRHQITLAGPMPERESVQLSLHARAHHVEVAAQGWTVEGLHEDGLADDDLQLTRARARGADAGPLQAGALPPFVRVERTLQIGLNWQVTTRVVRASPPGSAVVLEVPLLAGESVTTADVRVVGGKALVNMAPSVTEVTWRSVLEERSPVKLTASSSLSWIELWRVDVGPIWHATYDGIPFVHTDAGPGGTLIPLWRPWPGEQATVTLVRPEGVAGQTLTIDQSRLSLTPGLRATDAALSLTLRSSRGQQHTVTLPPDSQLESLSLNGSAQPVRQDGRKVTFEVAPGAQTVALAWREPRGLTARFDTSEVDLGAPSVNATVEVAVPGGRWLLLAGGPRLGPAVLFWSELLVLLLVALVLGRTSLAPLRAWQWLLLAVGLAPAGVVPAALVAGWLLALGWRQRRPGDGLAPALFDLRQVALVAWTLAALGVLVAAMVDGLLGAPDMQVQGNGSTSGSLVWFADRSGPSMPAAWALTVPMLAYRLVMLAWALWAAFAVLRWLQWAWAAFRTGGTWRRRPPRPAIPPPPAPIVPPVAPPPAGAGEPPGGAPPLG